MILKETQTRNGKVTYFRDFRGHKLKIETAPVFEDRKLLGYETTLKIMLDRPKQKESIFTHTKQNALQRHDGIVGRLQREEDEEWLKH